MSLFLKTLEEEGVDQRIGQGQTEPQLLRLTNKKETEEMVERMRLSTRFNRVGISKRRVVTAHLKEAGETKNLIMRGEERGEGGQEEEEEDINRTSKTTNLHQQTTDFSQSLRKFKEVVCTSPTMRGIGEGEEGGGEEEGGVGDAVMMMMMTPISHQDLQLDTAWEIFSTRS
jgi:hypothetical protein